MSCTEHSPHTEIARFGSSEPVIVYCSCGHQIYPPVPEPDLLRPVERFIQTGALDR